MRKLILSCLRKCIRKDVEEDVHILDDIDKTDKKEKTEHQIHNEPQPDALQALNRNLDDFLAMYEDEDENEEENKEENKEENEDENEDISSKESSLLPEFTCCYCHSNEYDNEDDTPCIICHFAPNSVHCILSW